MDNDQLHEAVETFRAAYAAMQQAETTTNSAYEMLEVARNEQDRAVSWFRQAKAELLRLAANASVDVDVPHIPSLT